MSRGIHFDRFTTQIEVPSTDSWKKGRKFHVADAPFTVFNAYQNYVMRVTVNVETEKNFFLVTQSKKNGSFNVERFSKDTHKENIADAIEMIRQRARNGLMAMHVRLEMLTSGMEENIKLLDADIEVLPEREGKTSFIMENSPMGVDYMQLEDTVSE